MKRIKVLIATIILFLAIGGAPLSSNAASKSNIDVHAKKLNSMQGAEQRGARIRVKNHDRKNYDYKYKIFKKNKAGVFKQEHNYKWAEDGFLSKSNTLFQYDYKYYFKNKTGKFKVRFAIYYKGKHVDTVTSNAFEIIKYPVHQM
ncbi:hypothetical protein FHK07_12015 [Listeria monocytogenes]|nr:hypothetical protein [Listeria monocytogenes]EJM6842200.1 hypothetical protein [Listeria monocytogenes]